MKNQEGSLTWAFWLSLPIPGVLPSSADQSGGNPARLQLPSTAIQAALLPSRLAFLGQCCLGTLHTSSPHEREHFERGGKNIPENHLLQEKTG